MVDGKDDIIKRRKIASCISAQWIVADQNTIFLPELSVYNSCTKIEHFWTAQKNVYCNNKDQIYFKG